MMSEELRRGIPKPIPGKKIPISEEEKERINRTFEEILKKAGAMREDEHIEDWKNNPN